MQDVLEDCRDLAATSALWHLCNVCSRPGTVAVCNLGMHPAPLPKGHATLREQHLEWLHRVMHMSVYDLSGYLIHARRKRIEHCNVCMNTLITKEDIPNDSEYPDNLVILIEKGGLKKSYPDFFF